MEYNITRLTKETMPSKLNFLLITSDQQRWDTLGCNNAKIKTPNLDRLVARGMVFDRAYTTNPVCTPSRISMLTGHYPSRHGCYTIGTSLPTDYPTLPAEMSRQGYFTGLLGKGHFSSCLDPNSFEAAPNVHQLDYFSHWDGPWYGFDRVQLCIGHSNEAHACGMHYGAWLEQQGVDRSLYFGKGQYTDYGPWALPEQFHNSKWVADTTIDAIERAKILDKPFFLWSSFQDPHNPCVAPEPWSSMYNPDDMPVYDSEKDQNQSKPPLYELRVKEERFGSNEEFGNKNWHCVRTSKAIGMDDRRKKQEIMAQYYGMVSLMDHHIGRIMDHLERCGQLDNTVIVFTTDHGDYMGNHDLWWKGLPAYEDIQRLPYIVSHPHCQTPGARSSAIQSTLDLAPTFMSMADMRWPELVQGVNQTQSWLHAEHKNRDWAMVEFRPSQSDFMQKTFVFEKYKLVVYHRPEWGELYDMRCDPEQLNNLWSRPEYQKEKMRVMGRMLSAEMEKDGVLRTRHAPA